MEEFNTKEAQNDNQEFRPGERVMIKDPETKIYLKRSVFPGKDIDKQEFVIVKMYGKLVYIIRSEDYEAGMEHGGPEVELVCTPVSRDSLRPTSYPRMVADGG
jgi:hypothetical protein